MSTEAKAKDLKTILQELKTLQDEYTGKVMPTEVGERFDRLAEEAKALQDEQDRKRRIRMLEEGSRVVDRPALPDEGKSNDPDEVVGYMSLGEAFTASPEFKRFAERGYPQTEQVMVSFNGGSFHLDQKGMRIAAQGGAVPVTRKMIEQKATPALTGWIQADRQNLAVRATELQRLTIRDLLNVSRTTSNSIEYTTLNAVTRVAATVADGAVKPETAMGGSTGTAAVRTIAVWIPVTEQQLQDVPQIENLINVQLTWELGRTEEEQLTWGDGTGNNLLGIFNTPGVNAGRAVSGDTIIDRARRAMTDIAREGLQANGIVMDPLDWETAQLTKATTNEYVWAVVTDDNGSRLWGLRVIESLAVTKPTLAVNTNTIYERRMLVGDFARGATLWDRQQAGVQVGYKNDDFIRNLRTIRAEERLAFAVLRPKAFRYVITQAEAA